MGPEKNEGKNEFSYPINIFVLVSINMFNFNFSENKTFLSS